MNLWILNDSIAVESRKMMNNSYLMIHEYYQTVLFWNNMFGMKIEKLFQKNCSNFVFTFVEIIKNKLIH